jgi:hypothetical protein
MFTLSVRQPDWQKAVQEIALSEDDMIRLVLEQVGKETVAYLKGLTKEERGWASITGHLAASYQAPVVTKIKDGWRLTLANTAYYAVFLEARDGMFVLSGVTDPGGPVEKALIDVCQKIAPDWTVVAGPTRAAKRFR